MGSTHWQKQSSRRQDERPQDADKTAGACAKFNALFNSAAVQEAQSREADIKARDAAMQARNAAMQARNAAIAEVRLQIERYSFEPEELGLSIPSA